MTKWLGGAALASWVMIIVLLAISWLLAFLLVGHTRKRVEASWSRDLVSFDVLSKRYESHELNQKAMDLDRAVEPLGFILSEAPKVPTRALEKRTDGIWPLRKGLKDYFDSEVQEVRAELNPPPPEIVAFVEAHRGDLDRVVQVLTTGSYPSWKCYPERLQEAPVPQLIRMIDLQRLLWARAAILERQNQHEEAVKHVSAAWRLTTAIARRNELICTLIALSMARRHAALLRKITYEPSSWDEDLSALKMQDAMMRSYFYEAWVWHGIERRKRIDDQSDLDPLGRYWKIPILGEYLRFQIVGMLDRWRENILELKGLSACPIDAKDYDNRLHFPKWNIIGNVGQTNIFPGWSRSQLGNIEFDLTRRVLKGRAGQERIAGLSQWFEPTPCPDLFWRFQQSADETLEIQCSRDVEVLLDTKARLPLRVVLLDKEKNQPQRLKEASKTQ